MSLLFSFCLQAQESPLTQSYITNNINQISVESVRAFIQERPASAMAIHKAAMSLINFEDIMIEVESTPEEKAANGGVVCISMYLSHEIPAQYEHIVAVINETFVSKDVLISWIGACNSDECYQDEAYFRLLIMAQAINKPESLFFSSLLACMQDEDVWSDLVSVKDREGKSFLDRVYECALHDKQEILKEKSYQVIQKKGTIPPLGFNEGSFRFLQESPYPLWAYQFDRKSITQTEAHLFDTPQAHRIWGYLEPEIRELFYQVHHIEQQEHAKGNYVFYHAQNWDYHLYADLYKQLWNIVKNDTVGNDFTFVRFNEQNEAPDERGDYLWMNGSLFGNAYIEGDCTAAYFYCNRSIRKNDDLIENLFCFLHISSYYEKYKDQLMELKKLHEQANEGTNVGAKTVSNGKIESYSGCGNLLLISIPADKMGLVRVVWPGIGQLRDVTLIDGTSISDAQRVIDTMIANPALFAKPFPEFPAYVKISDFLVYTLPLTIEYALDPHNGPRIYQFNAADKEKLKKYIAARDALCAQIKQDIQVS